MPDDVRRRDYSSHKRSHITDFIAAPGWFGFVPPTGRAGAVPNSFARSGRQCLPARRLPRCTRDASETSPFRRAAIQYGELDPHGDAEASKGVTASFGDPPRESRPACVRGFPASPHRLQFSDGSVVGPHRWSRPAVRRGGRRLSSSTRVDRVGLCAPGPAVGPIQRQRGRACAAARRAGSVSR